MKLTTIPTWRTPHGTIAFIQVNDMAGYRYRISWRGKMQKSWWKTATANMARLAILRAAARAAGLPEYHYWDSKTEPGTLPEDLSFDGIHQP